jgi:lipopolysaccharide export system permease protein
MSIYLVLDVMDKIPRFVKAGGAPVDMLRFFVWKLPEMIGQAAPFSILVATLLTLGLLSGSGEITAMNSCGVSLLRISLPMLALGMLSSLLLLANAELLVPTSYERRDHIERIDIRKQGVNTAFRLNNIWFRSETMILQAGLFVPQESKLKGVIVWKVDSAMNPVGRIDAESAEFHGNVWTLRNAKLKDFSKGSGYTTQTVPAIDIPLNLKLDDLKILDNDAENLNYAKLREYADNLRRGGYKASRYQTMMNSKLSAPFAAFVMVVLGIPFAIRNRRSGGTLLGIVAGIAIGFTYFVTSAVLLSYGRTGVLPPILAAWGTNILFVLSGIWLALTI